MGQSTEEKWDGWLQGPQPGKLWVPACLSADTVWGAEKVYSLLIISYDALEVCHGIYRETSRDTTLPVISYILILLCLGCSWSPTFGEWVCSPQPIAADIWSWNWEEASWPLASQLRGWSWQEVSWLRVWWPGSWDWRRSNRFYARARIGATGLIQILQPYFAIVKVF